MIFLKFIRAFVILLFCGQLFACSKAPSTRYDYAESHGAEQKTKESNNLGQRVILYSASLDLVVESPDSVYEGIQQVAQHYGGYVNHLNGDQMIIRVKSDHFNQAVADISTLGKVKDKRIVGNDVTEDYLDYQIRLENALKVRDRYLKLLEFANDISSAIKVEKELERLNGEIDSLKGKIQRLDHLNEFSTITVIVKERKKPGLIGYVGIALYHSVKWLFVRN